MRKIIIALPPVFLMLLLGYLLLLISSFFTSVKKPLISLSPSQITIAINETKPLSWQERAYEIQSIIDKQVVFYEAIDMGLLETKSAQSRIKKITQLTEKTHHNDKEQAIIYSDPLLKNYLTITLENIIKDNFPKKEIKKGQIDTWIKNNPQKTKMRLTISHVFIKGFSPKDKKRAFHIFKKITTQKIPVQKAFMLGDRFYGPRTFYSISTTELSNHFGNEIFSSNNNLVSQRWLKPETSAYGWHIFYIHDIKQHTTNKKDIQKEAINALQKKEAQKTWQAWLNNKKEKYDYHIMLPDQWQEKITITKQGIVQCQSC